MILSNANLETIRTRPQSSKLWLSVYKPPVVMACLVATSHGQGAYQIDYDTVSQGHYSSIESGMTMLIGTSAGASDIGKIRVRSADANQITVAENSFIDWTAGYFLTIIRFWEINTIFPRIIQDPSDELNTIWYKDNDIAYTNQNDVLGSFVCMGSHYAGFLETGSHGVYYTASGTYNVMGDTVTYSWWFQGATVTGSSSHTPGFIQYNTPGYYTTRLQVTTPTGTYDASYRHISIYDRPENGTNIPILRWNLKSFSGSRDNGGYTAKIAVYEDFSSIVDGALVVIFADDYYGDTKISYGNYANRGSIVFVGYILDGSISFNYKNTSLEFTVGSPTSVMKDIEAFAVGVNSSASPVNEPNINENITSGWSCVKNMNIARALYHYLRWHSTALMTNDFELRITDKNIQYFDADRESLYSAVQTLLDGSLTGEFVCSRDGKMWAESSTSSRGSALGLGLAMSLDNKDWMGTVRINEQPTNRVSQLEMGGIYYPGPGFESTPLLSQAPGTTPSYHGSVEKRSGLALLSQSQLNILTGDVFAWRNSRYPSTKLDLSGNYRNLDIAPIERVQLTMLSSDNFRGISWSAKNFVIQDMDFSYNPEKELLVSTIDIHETTDGMNGATITIPPVPPTTEPGGGGFSIPTIEIPSIPSFPITIEFTGGGANYPQYVFPVTVDPAAEDWDTRADWSSYPGGLFLGAAEDQRAVGFLKIPTGYTGIVTVTSWFSVGSPSASGNVRVGVGGEFYAWLDNSENAIEVLLGGGGYTYQTIDPATGIFFYQGPSATLTVSAADREYFGRLYLYRNGLSGLDTFTGQISAVGWTIEYA